MVGSEERNNDKSYVERICDRKNIPFGLIRIQGRRIRIRDYVWIVYIVVGPREIASLKILPKP